MLLHRLVLSGIGGGTLRQAGAAISTEELQSWAQFERQYGPLDLGSRLDYWFSMICMLMVNRTGGWSKNKPAKPGDFMPKPDALEEQAKPDNIHALAAALGATTRKRK